MRRAAVASRLAEPRVRAERVAIFDFDVHHANGTEDCVGGVDGMLLLQIYAGRHRARVCAARESLLTRAQTLIFSTRMSVARRAASRRLTVARRQAATSRHANVHSRLLRHARQVGRCCVAAHRRADDASQSECLSKTMTNVSLTHRTHTHAHLHETHARHCQTDRISSRCSGSGDQTSFSCRPVRTRARVGDAPLNAPRRRRL